MMFQAPSRVLLRVKCLGAHTSTLAASTIKSPPPGQMWVSYIHRTRFCHEIRRDPLHTRVYPIVSIRMKI